MIVKWNAMVMDIAMVVEQQLEMARVHASLKQGGPMRRVTSAHMVGMKRTNRFALCGNARSYQDCCDRPGQF